EAIQKLIDGNKRFLSGKMLPRNFPEQVKQTASAPNPFAAVLTCMDSRTPPELIFDQGFGDMFAMRVGGNIINEDVLGSLEFAAKYAGVKVILVMGHTECAAIKGACDDLKGGNMTALLEKLKPAVNAVPQDIQPRTSKNQTFVSGVAETNAKHSQSEIMKRSPILKELHERGEIAIIASLYDVHTGQITFYEQ
ncbi:MAG TPA: carbonic anhydrase, partial [Candidatus Kapabacteria bacterium]|nr:carbonic anhydrase [Candidatus Kapabacteria bacterium]